MAITNFTKQNLSELRTDVNAALADVMKKHGILLEIGNISFSENQFTTKLTAKTGNLTSADGAKKEWDKHAYLYGMKPEWFGMTVIVGSAKHTITKILPNKHKNVVQITSATGKNYITSAATICAMLK